MTTATLTIPMQPLALKGTEGEDVGHAQYTPDSAHANS